MPRGYMVVTYRKVADEATMQAYAAVALPALMTQGARFLVRAPGQAVTVREAGLQERTVLIEFPSKEQAVAAYDSDSYQAAARLLAGKADRDVRFVEETLAVPGAQTP